MGEFYDSSETCVSDAVQNAKQAFTDWKRLSAYERGKVLKKAANLIRVCDQKKIEINSKTFLSFMTASSFE